MFMLERLHVRQSPRPSLLRHCCFRMGPSEAGCESNNAERLQPILLYEQANGVPVPQSFAAAAATVATAAAHFARRLLLLERLYERIRWYLRGWWARRAVCYLPPRTRLCGLRGALRRLRR